MVLAMWQSFPRLVFVFGLLISLPGAGMSLIIASEKRDEIERRVNMAKANERLRDLAEKGNH